jgi:hypothetical protein
MTQVLRMTKKLEGQHLVCGKCGMLLDCDWMGISLDYDDECKFGSRHCTLSQTCDCESRVNKDMNKANDILSGEPVTTIRGNGN